MTFQAKANMVTGGASDERSCSYGPQKERQVGKYGY